MLTPLEKAVLEKLLERRGEPFDTLRRQVSCANVAILAASMPGEALESEDMVKLVNARKHRHREASHTRLFKAGAKTARSRVRAL